MGVDDGGSAYDDSKFYEQEGNPRTTSARDYTYTTEGLAKPPPGARFPARDEEVENVGGGPPPQPPPPPPQPPPPPPLSPPPPQPPPPPPEERDP